MNESELRERTRKLLAEVHPDAGDDQRIPFRGAQFDAGLAWVNYPEGLGGLGLEPKMQAIVQDELHKGANTYYEGLLINPIGIGMGAPVVLAYGREEGKRELLRNIFTGEEIWCQLFSEPSAGSDVAGLAARAVRDGDDWVVNGQKVWTTLAHISRWGMLVVRTNPDIPKHDGLSYFMLDMHAPGVEVRPLYQITGEAEFNEVFLNDVRIPQEHMLGVEGQGWKVAIATLMNERVMLGGGASTKGGGPISTLLELLETVDVQRSPAEDAVLRDRVAQLYIESELLRLTGVRARISRTNNEPGPEGSVGKLAQADISKAIWQCCSDVLGPDALVYEHGYKLRQGRTTASNSTLQAKYNLLRSRAYSIEGGTSEIMRNILGERVLGLPGEPRVDKNIPWKEVPRS
ncbi:MAG: acyl-CoA dehydrogenase family protein [Deltaproteobacteria bacterium]|nr:acyl-CoA dehydrogenase family protein [Deltaproteobacteria bacterium]